MLEILLSFLLGMTITCLIIFVVFPYLKKENPFDRSQKSGRGRPKGAKNKPKQEGITA